MKNMKQLIVAVSLLALSAASLQTARAGDREWATVGKVLTGVAAASVIVNALDCRPTPYAVTYAGCAPVDSQPCPAPVVYVPVRPPVVYIPAPVVVYQRPVYCAPRPIVSGHIGHSRWHREHGFCR